MYDSTYSLSTNKHNTIQHEMGSVNSAFHGTRSDEILHEVAGRSKWKF
jgi:hypothetical protein